MTLNNGFPPNNYQHAPSIQLNIHPDYNRYQTSNDSNMQQYPSISVVEQHGSIDPDSSRSTVGYMQLPFNKPIHFGYDEQGQIWYYIDDPRHPIPIADIVFLSVIDIVDPSNTVTPRRFVRYINKYGEFQQAFECSLLTKSTLYTIFSLDKVNEKCKKQLINYMLIFAMDRAKNHYRLEVSRYMGWHLTKDQHLLFYYREMIPPECVKECPSSVQKRRVVFPSQTSLDPPIETVENLLSNPDFAFLILLRYASMLLYFFTSKQIKPECVFVISGIETSQRSLCSYILNNIDYSSFYLSNDKLLKGDYSEISDINDGIALFNCNNETQKSFTRILKNAVDELRNAQNSIDAAQHLTILLSELQYSSQNNNVCHISLDAINDPDLSNIHQSLQEQLSELDNKVIKRINTLWDGFIYTLNEAIVRSQQMIAQLHSEHKNALYMLTSALYLLKNFFIAGFTKDFTFQTIHKYLNQQNYHEETQEFVVHEFKKILNERIEQKMFNIIDRKEIDTHIHTESELKNTVIINNDRILLMKDTLNNMVETEMHRIQSCVQIWRSLRLAGHMYCTNGYQNPLEVMLATGQMCLLHTYAFKRSILTPNNYSSLFHRQNVGQEEYFMHKNQIETIKPGFLTLLSNECNQYAGRLLLDENEENGHIIVTGQSGSGKTVTLFQLAAFHAAMHHRVIAFDSSSSLSVEKFCKHLPEKFVNEHVLFYDIEKYGIPINPFLMYDNSSIHKNSTVLGLLASSASDLSPHQCGTLSAALENLDYSEDIHASDILNAINKQKSAKKLLERFEAVLNAIHRYEQTSISTGNNYSSWDEFIKQHEKTPIIIFSAPLGYSPYRTPLIDILLASLYNYQICHKNQPLDILIDELQKENTSKNSPIEQLISVGRNYNISVLAATQHFNVTKNLKELIGNIQTKIFLHPTSNSISAIQACIGTKKLSIDYFNGMDRGECFIDSTFYSLEMKENKHTVLCGELAKFSAFYEG